MLLLKVSCQESDEMGAHPKHYAMKVVGVWSDEGENKIANLPIQRLV
jgi:hypothetical protein